MIAKKMTLRGGWAMAKRRHARQQEELIPRCYREERRVTPSVTPVHPGLRFNTLTLFWRLRLTWLLGEKGPGCPRGFIGSRWAPVKGIVH
jgi:hypothetical protein